MGKERLRHVVLLTHLMLPVHFVTGIFYVTPVQFANIFPTSYRWNSTDFIGYILYNPGFLDHIRGKFILEEAEKNYKSEPPL